MKYSLCFCYYDRYFCVSSVHEQKSSNPVLMSYNLIVFPCISITKVTVFIVIFATFTFIKMGLTPGHDLNTSCVEYILILQMAKIRC